MPTRASRARSSSETTTGTPLSLYLWEYSLYSHGSTVTLSLQFWLGQDPPLGCSMKWCGRGRVRLWHLNSQSSLCSTGLAWPDWPWGAMCCCRASSHSVCERKAGPQAPSHGFRCPLAVVRLWCAGRSLRRLSSGATPLRAPSSSKPCRRYTARPPSPCACQRPQEPVHGVPVVRVPLALPAAHKEWCDVWKSGACAPPAPCRRVAWRASSSRRPPAG